MTPTNPADGADNTPIVQAMVAGAIASGATIIVQLPGQSIADALSIAPFRTRDARGAQPVQRGCEYDE